MIGKQGITIIAYKSDSGYWVPYMLYRNGPFPGAPIFNPNYDWVFIVDDDHVGTLEAKPGTSYIRVHKMIAWEILR